MSYIKLTEDEKKKIESYEKNGTTIVCSKIHGECYSNNYEITDTEDGLVICTDCGCIYRHVKTATSLVWQMQVKTA